MDIDSFTLEKTIYDAIVSEEELPIFPKIHGMDFVPSNINLCAAEIELTSMMMREFRLKNTLEPYLVNYDFILIDCPPSLGILSIISLVASTHILIPIQTQFKAFQGTELLLNTLAKLRQSANKNLALTGFIPTMYDKRTAQESRTYQAILEQLSPLATVFEPIPRSIAFADATEKKVPLAVYKPKHPAVKILKNITKELIKIQS